jgi:CheY-like chemotaxis protein
MIKKRILIVEDQTDARELFSLMLRRLGYDISEAISGLEAIDQATSARPELIFMDLALPGIKGYEATARLKADPATRDIPVIVLTAYHYEAEQVRLAIEAGAAEVHQKPIGLKALKLIAHRYLTPDQPSETDVAPGPHYYTAAAK